MRFRAAKSACNALNEYNLAKLVVENDLETPTKGTRALTDEYEQLILKDLFGGEGGLGISPLRPASIPAHSPVHTLDNGLGNSKDPVDALTRPLVEKDDHSWFL